MKTNILIKKEIKKNQQLFVFFNILYFQSDSGISKFIA